VKQYWAGAWFLCALICTPHDAPLDLFTFGAKVHQADTFSQCSGPDTDRSLKDTA